MTGTTAPITDRRKDANSQAVVLLIQSLQSDLGQLKDDLRNTVRDALAEGFPEGDASAHRAHHEGLIKAANERAEFYKALRVKLAEWGLIAFAGWALWALWQAFLLGPRK